MDSRHTAPHCYRESERKDVSLRDVFGKVLLEKQVGETLLIVVQLAYHVALYVNPTADYGYDDRYCICSIAVAMMTIEHFEKTGEICFWQKHHNRRIRVVGEYLYKDGELCTPENALQKVSWNADQLRELYPQDPQVSVQFR